MKKVFLYIAVGVCMGASYPASLAASIPAAQAQDREKDKARSWRNALSESRRLEIEQQADQAAVQQQGAAFNASDAGVVKQDGLFGSRETRKTNMQAYKSWTGVMQRTMVPAEEQIRVAKVKGSTFRRKKSSNLSAFSARAKLNQQSAPKTVDQGTKCTRYNRVQCKKDEWDTFIADQQKQAGTTGISEDILSAVNLFMNETPYIIDPYNWGVPDYWATPTEFFYKDGDCEDYAISKYITLKRIGVDTKAMRIVTGQDMNSRISHTVLAVDIDGTEYILDNQVNVVLPHTNIRHFRPVYSINEYAWWSHVPRINY